MQSNLLVKRQKGRHHRTARLLGLALGFLAVTATAWGVKPGTPSFTAEGVAAYRAIAALAPDSRIRNPDHLAHKLVSREYWRNAPFTLDYEASKRFIDKYKVSVYHYVNARTKHIDKLLERAAVDGTRQVVNLGAGYDSRAYRFAGKMPGVIFFELDLPATVDAKRERLLTFMDAIPRQVKLLKIDFNTQTLEQVLSAAGYDPSLKTFFIWEGVTYYISEAAVGGTLAFIATMSPPGSSVVFDYMPSAVIQKAYQDYPDAPGPMARVARMGEPWVFGISEGRAECYANSQGLQVLSILYPREMESRYLYRSDGVLDGHAPTYFRIMQAVVPKPEVKQHLIKKGCSPMSNVATAPVGTHAQTAVKTKPVEKTGSAARGSRDAEAVNQVLKNWVRYWDAGDVSGIMTLLNTDARMMYGGLRRKMATYTDYPDILPGRMAAVGNCVLTEPDIRIKGKTATVQARQETVIGYISVTFLLKKNDAGWKITRFEYEL